MSAAPPADLPSWQLDDLYAGPDDPAIEADMAAAEAGARRFEADFKGRLASLDGPGLAAAIVRLEALQDAMGRLASYAQLLAAADRSDPRTGRFQQDIEERLTQAGLPLVFFTLELNRIDDDAMAALCGHPAMARWRPWIDDARALRRHQLDDAAEAMLHELSVVLRQPWTRLFDETVAALRFEIGGQSLTEARALDLLSSPDGAKRREAAGALAAVFRANEKLFAHIANTLAKAKEIEDGWRRFPRPISARNLENRVEDEVVEALIAAVIDAWPRLSHRYYGLKARWLGADALPWWDRLAPLPGAVDIEIGWDEARRLVLEAFAAFSPTMAAIASDFFEKRWIDAAPREGKDGGAFSHPTVPSAHPCILLNYQGRLRDAMTLAHELGHGVHQVLAAPQGALLAPTPLTLAETASVFGEQLAFRRLLAGERDPRRRRAILAGKVEDMLNTVMRQIAFCEFERRLHDARRAGELTPGEIGELWLAVQGESLGPAVAFDDDYRSFWCYIPHFVHTPFYVYAYAFGDCLVNALYARYLEEEEGFEERFLDLLRAGGSRKHGELLAPFGLDASSPAFWATGLETVERLIDDLEALDA